MPLESSGPISIGGSTLGRSINLELSRSATATSSLNETAFRALAGVPSGTISLASFYGKSSQTYFINRLYDASNLNNFTVGYSVTTSASDKSIYLSGMATTENQNYGGLVVKYNASGTLQWSRAFGLGSAIYFYDSATDSSGNVYVGGDFGQVGGVLVKYNSSGVEQWRRGIFDDMYGNNMITGFSVVSGFIYIGLTPRLGFGYIKLIKLDTDAVLQWTPKEIGGNNYNIMFGMNTDNAGNSYILAQSNSTNASWSTAATYEIIKYNSNGARQWQRTLSGLNNYMYDAGQKGPGDVTTDTLGNVYFATGSQYYTYGIIGKYDSNGTLQWQREFGGADSNRTFVSCATDSSGNVYAVAKQLSIAEKVWIVKYNTNGTLQWQRSLTRTTAGVILVHGCFVDTNDVLYISGEFISNNWTVFEMIFLKLKSDGTPTGTYDGYIYAATTDPSVVSTYSSSVTTYQDSDFNLRFQSDMGLPPDTSITRTSITTTIS